MTGNLTNELDMRFNIKLLFFALIATIALPVAHDTAQAADPTETIAVIDSALTDSTKLSGEVVYVDFWASWCVPCRQSFPWLQSLLDRYGKQGLKIVAVNLDNKPEAATKFLKELPVDFSIVYDSNGVLAKVYNLDAMPTSYVYGRDGKLRFHHLGFQPKDTMELQTKIFDLLKEKPTP